MGKKGMAPLWLKYPQIPNGSIGWRMGYGEAYGDKFYGWFHTLDSDGQKNITENFRNPSAGACPNTILCGTIHSGPINGTGIPARLILWKSFRRRGKTAA